MNIGEYSLRLRRIIVKYKYTWAKKDCFQEKSNNKGKYELFHMYFILNIAEKHVSRNGANNTRWASFISRVPFEKCMKAAKISFGCFRRNSKKTDNRITSACVWHVTIIIIKVIPLKLFYYQTFFETWGNEHSWYEHYKNAIKIWGHRACLRVSRLLKWGIFTGCTLKVWITFIQN